MQYLLAAFGAAATTALMWKAFGPQRTAASRRRVLAPDDDPEFLRNLNARLNSQRRDNDEEA